MSAASNPVFYDAFEAGPGQRKGSDSVSETLLGAIIFMRVVGNYGRTFIFMMLYVWDSLFYDAFLKLW